ncbi:hypothetical protein K5E59_000215 [Enterobacter hormaechei]|nr:hypothetical protein [Enterobacter hormaechei]
MITLTKEWLLTTIAELEEERDAVPGVVNVDAAMALAAMKLARASLEAEIHSYTFEDDPRPLYTAPPAPEVYNIGYATMRHIFTPAGITDVSDMQAVFDQIETVLAGMWQPAPVSVPDAIEPTVEAIKRILPTSNPDGYAACIGADMWNACRAAMLQGADGNAPAHFRSRPAKSSLSPAQGGNSPAIPDGWVLVPEEPTHEMLEAGDEQFGTYDVYRRMIAASPQQEVKP